MKTRITVIHLSDVAAGVSFQASDKAIFQKLLCSFKARVASKHRSFSKLTVSWHVSLLGLPALERWLSEVAAKHPRFEIVREEQAITRPSDPLGCAFIDTLQSARQLLASIKQSGSQK